MRLFSRKWQSDHKLTKSVRTKLCAATHGVSAAARISHGPAGLGSMACELQPLLAFTQELSSSPLTQPALAFTRRNHVGSLTIPALLFFK